MDRGDTRAARRRRRQRRRTALVAVPVVVVAAGTVALVLARGGGGHSNASVAVPGTTVAIEPATTLPTVPPTEPPTTTTTEPDPGSLPQTPERPVTGSATFQDHMNALWRAIQSDDASVAMPAFFPLGAYLQVKAISNPESDYRTRLLGAYAEDIHALHAKLGARAATAQLTGVDVPDAQAVWVQPGAEYNKGSYWRVYGANLRYATPDGQSGVFPIASLISWRGEWYVVHLSSIR